MNLVTLSRSIGDVLYEKGLIGHVTVDLVSFPNPTQADSHPLFWAVDISAQLSDNATACLFFDILMEGKLDPETGEYEIETMEGEDDMAVAKPNDKLNIDNIVNMQNKREPRNFMFCNFLHHPGLSTI